MSDQQIKFPFKKKKVSDKFSSRPPHHLLRGGKVLCIGLKALHTDHAGKTD